MAETKWCGLCHANFDPFIGHECGAKIMTSSSTANSLQVVGPVLCYRCQRMFATWETYTGKEHTCYGQSTYTVNTDLLTEKLKTRIQKLETTLQFYAEKTNYDGTDYDRIDGSEIHLDKGNKAIEALKED